MEEDSRREGDEMTMSVFADIANSVDPNMEVEVDFPSNYETKWMPILDMKMTMDTNNKVAYMFYRKPMCNKCCTAMPERPIWNILTCPHDKLFS